MGGQLADGDGDAVDLAAHIGDLADGGGHRVDVGQAFLQPVRRVAGAFLAGAGHRRDFLHRFPRFQEGAAQPFHRRHLTVGAVRHLGDGRRGLTGGDRHLHGRLHHRTRQRPGVLQRLLEAPHGPAQRRDLVVEPGGGYLRRDVAVGQPAQRLGHAAQRSDDALPDQGHHGYQGQQGQRSADGADAQPFFAQLGGARVHQFDELVVGGQGEAVDGVEGGAGSQQDRRCRSPSSPARGSSSGRRAGTSCPASP